MRKSFGGLLALVLISILCNGALAAITIVFLMDGSSTSKSGPVGVYGQTAPNTDVTIQVKHGAASITKFRTSDANGFFNASFAAPEGGWTVGAGQIVAWRDDDLDDKDTNGITFTDP